MTEQTLALPGIETPPTSLRFNGSVWGFDPSTRRIALAVLDGRPDKPPELGWFSLEVRELDLGPGRLAGLREDLLPWLSRYLDAAPPVLMAVEQPFGQGKARPHPQSYYIVAVLLEALHHVTDGTVPVGVIEPSGWKSSAMGEGQGFAKKGAILRWARSHGYPNNCPKCEAAKDECDRPDQVHDEADAIGIATAAAVRLALGRPLR